MLFELARRRAATAAELAADLGLDAGYLSRMLGGFRRRGLLRRETPARDRRTRVLRLTAKGKRAFNVLDRRADADVADMLAPLPVSEQARLVDGMAAVRGVLDPGSARIVLRRPRSGDFGWIVHRHGALYRLEYG